jgi:hypothetical protein
MSSDQHEWCRQPEDDDAVMGPLSARAGVLCDHLFGLSTLITVVSEAGEQPRPVVNGLRSPSHSALWHPAP